MLYLADRPWAVLHLWPEAQVKGAKEKKAKQRMWSIVQCTVCIRCFSSWRNVRSSSERRTCLHCAFHRRNFWASLENSFNSCCFFLCVFLFFFTFRHTSKHCKCNCARFFFPVFVHLNSFSSVCSGNMPSSTPNHQWWGGGLRLPVGHQR